MCCGIMMALLSCPLCCQSSFSSVDLLRTSLISIISRPLICPICSAVQPSLDDLATHLTQHIEVASSQFGNPNATCDANNVIHNININNTNASECGVNRFAIERKSDENMTRKLDTPSPVLSSVSINESESRKSPRINVQISEHIVEPIVCNLCECTFRSQELQQMHMQLVHEINIRPSNEASKLANALIISPALLQCNLCPKRFKMAGSLRLHVRMVHGVSHVPMQQQRPANALDCETADNNLVATTAGNEKEMQTGDLIASTSPSSSLSSSPSKSPLQHVNSSNQPHVHNNQSDYYNNYGLADVATFGNGEHTAIECTSNGNNNSKEMIANNNNDDRVHKCDICNKRFTTKYFLKKHKRLHTGKNNTANVIDNFMIDTL